MVLLDTQLTDPPSVHPTCIVQQPFQAGGYFTSQYAPTIFRYPYQVVLQAVFRMRPGAIFNHSQIMPETPPLRQVSPGSAPKGGHSSPGLKAWGFLADFIKNRNSKGVNKGVNSFR
jgi:hypothetical protein